MKRPCLFWLVLATLLPSAGVAEQYGVRVSDTLHLRVMDWQPIEGLVREWPAMAGEYVVGMDGTISVPFLGSVAAAGRSSVEIGEDVSAGLAQRFALPDPPDATVEVIEYGPVFVSGVVRTPGRYDFRPGLTVQQLLSMAGGPVEELRRTSGAMREIISSEGALQILKDQHTRLVIRRARLEYEVTLAVTTDPAAPLSIGPIPDLIGSPASETIMADETAIMQSRQDQLVRETAAIESQKALLQSEIVSLDAKAEALKRQRDLSLKEMESANALAEKGLIANSRLFDTERGLATIENQLLDVATAILRAKQGVAEAERDRIALIDAHAAEVALQHQEVQAAIEETERRIETQQLLSINAAFVAEGDVASPMSFAEPVVVILRAQDGAMREIAADMAAELQPGDVLDLRLPEPSTN